MTENEIAELYQGLLQILRQTDSQYLIQVADRVESLVDQGKIVKDKAQVDFDDEDSFPPSKRNSRTRKTTRTIFRREDYSPKERIQLLLEAIEAALVNPSIIRAQTAHFFSEEARTLNMPDDEIKLYQGISDNEEPIILTTQSSNREIDQIEQLRTAISRIRAELNDVNR